MLHVEAGPASGVSFLLADGAIIGRNQSAAIAFGDKLISRQHGTIELTKRGVVVYSDHSHNGTFYQKSGSDKPDCTLHNTAAVLHEGDRLLMGRTIVLYSSHPPKRSAPEPPSEHWWHSQQVRPQVTEESKGECSPGLVPATTPESARDEVGLPDTTPPVAHSEPTTTTRSVSRNSSPPADPPRRASPSPAAAPAAAPPALQRATVQQPSLADLSLDISASPDHDDSDDSEEESDLEAPVKVDVESEAESEAESEVEAEVEPEPVVAVEAPKEDSEDEDSEEEDSDGDISVPPPPEGMPDSDEEWY